MSRVYVGRISYQVREKDVERFFRGFGRIKDINLKNGFGFVEFDDPRDADDAVYECNGRELMGERIIVEHARGSSSYRGGGRGGGGDRGGGGGGGGGWGRGGGGGGGGRYENKGYGPPTRTEHRLHVENISSRVSWQDLKDFMRQAGDITYADAHKTKVGEGTVEYSTREDMKNAMKKLDGADLNGRRLRLTEERGGHSHYRSRSRSGSRDRRRSESRSRSRSRDRGRSRSPRSKSPGDDKKERRSRSRSRSREGSETRRSRSRSKSPAAGGAARDGEGGKERASHSKSRSRSPENGRPRSTSPDKERSGSPPGDKEMRSRSPSPTPAAKEDGHDD